jgi:hypothetical protein
MNKTNTTWYSDSDTETITTVTERVYDKHGNCIKETTTETRVVKKANHNPYRYPYNPPYIVTYSGGGKAVSLPGYNK